MGNIDARKKNLFKDQMLEWNTNITAAYILNILGSRSHGTHFCITLSFFSIVSFL